MKLYHANVLFACVIVLLFAGKAIAVPIGSLAVGQKSGDLSLDFGINFEMINISPNKQRLPDTNMTSKGFTALLRYSPVSELSIFADGGFSDIWLSNPSFKGYMGGAFGGGVRLSLPDPHRSRFTVNISADVYNIQSGNSNQTAQYFEYEGAILGAVKNANTILYGGLNGSNVSLSFPGITYNSTYNVGAVFGMDQFINPYLFFNFEAHIFDKQSIEGSIAYTFF